MVPAGVMFPQVRVQPALVSGLAEEHVEHHAFVAELVSCAEQLVGERLVKQASHGTGAVVGPRGLERLRQASLN